MAASTENVRSVCASKAVQWCLRNLTSVMGYPRVLPWASSIQFVKDGLVDLVRGEGGVEEFVKKKQFAEPQKGIKKIAHATL